MSKTVKLLIVLIFITYHFSFAISNYYSGPRYIYRQRKSGIWSSWPRSFKVNWPRKAFEITDRKTFDIPDIYSEKFLKDFDSQIVTKAPMIQQWKAAIETPSRKKNRFLETAQKPRQEENEDTVQSEELNSNLLEGPMEKLKNSRKEKRKTLEEKWQEKQNKNDRQKKEVSLLNPKIPVQNKPKRLQPEQDRNDVSILSQTEFDEKHYLRGDKHRSGLISRQDVNRYNHQCKKKCYTPKCEVECVGRQGSAACSADKCRASSRGRDSAAVCKGEKCNGLCSKEECIAACEGEACAVKCEGSICHAVAEGSKAESACEGDYCVAYGKGARTRPKCYGTLCQTWCVGDSCIAKCIGMNCEAMCSGRECKAQCVGKNCTKFLYSGIPPTPEKPWIVEDEDAISEEISISDESSSIEASFSSEPNESEYDSNVDDDGYNDISDNVPVFPLQIKVPVSNIKVPSNYKGNGNVTINYSIGVRLSEQLGNFLKKKIAQLGDASLLRYLPTL